MWNECDTHSLTRTRTLKGGWFGLTITLKYYIRLLFSASSHSISEPVGVVCVILCEIFLAIMKEYTADDETCIKSQWEWSQNSQWMQDMISLIFKSNQSLILKILHGLNLLFSLSSKFHPLPIIDMFHFFCKEDNWRSLLKLEFSKKWNNNNNNMFLKEKGEQQKRKRRRRRKPKRMS